MNELLNMKSRKKRVRVKKGRTGVFSSRPKRRHSKDEGNEFKDTWNECKMANVSNPYLISKQIPPGRVKEIDGNLVVPLVNNKRLVGLQKIDEEGRKNLLKDQRLAVVHSPWVDQVMTKFISLRGWLQH